MMICTSIWTIKIVDSSL